MKNNFILTALLTTSLSLGVQSADIDKGKDKGKSDFSYDPVSKSVVSKYLGKVFLIKGQATAYSSKGGKSQIKDQSKVFPGDKITTAPKSMVKIEMIDSTVITIAPRSEFEFAKWDYRKKSDRNGTFKLLKGRIRSHIKVKNAGKSSLDYKVRHVSMGIRGTRVLANAYTRSDKVKVSHVVVLSGKTEVYDSVADRKLKLEEGQEYISFLRPDGSLLRQTQSKLSPARIKELKAGDKNERKYFRPFVNYISAKNSSKVASEAEASSSQPPKRNSSRNKRNSKKKSWKKTLNQLNQRLNEDDN